MKPLVVKFGGTSVGTPEAIAAAARLTAAEAGKWGGVVCVVSAMNGVTDLLMNAARNAARGGDESLGSVTALRERHIEAADRLGCPPDLREEIEARASEFESLCRSIGVLREASPRALDAIGAIGERLSARLVAAALRSIGAQAQALDATELLVTDARFGDAAPHLGQTRARAVPRLTPLLERGVIPVVTGFIGATTEGIPTTLGRGGSDYSAAILGAALDAAEVWIFTDVDGVMTGDPRVVPEARVLESLSYAEIGELAYFGAKVLHPKTIRPLVESGIPIRIRNTFRPEHPGTRIVSEARTRPGAVKAVTAIGGLSLITVEGRGMLGVPGVAARAFTAVAAAEANVLMISQGSSEQSICFAVPDSHAAAVLAGLERAFELELHRRDVDRISSQEGVVIVSAVGAGMKGMPGVASRIFGALARESINIIAIAQGSSEYSISMVVSSADGPRAVRQVHALAVANGEEK